ncbi:cell wall-binding repeat-containing protein [Halalkalibacter okhensis]|uniref:cell wall-binding repeat-containing protein n=1 Tax=Halalkalibacter okhensis TaxID=333138 RepID=UPI00068ED109|nr:cell wall-binding repeat-containing protein [Halalkalibacter okhensis]
MYIVRHELIPYRDGFNLVIYLDPTDIALSEFASELLEPKPDRQIPIAKQHYVASQFDRIKIFSVKVIVGSMLVAVIPLNKDQMTVSAQSQISVPTETYSVVSGDTLFLIASRFNITVNELKNLNNLTSDEIFVGQALKVPSGSELKEIIELFGQSRYDTSVVISKAGWRGQADTVVLGRGDISIDALSASVLAKKHNSPLLLTQSTQLPASVAAEIDRLKPKTVYIAGGEQAVSQSIVNQLQAKGYQVVRISGQSRYDTSVHMAREVHSKPAEIILTTGDSNSPDALAIAPYAGIKQIPIVFTEKEQLPSTVRQFIQEKNIKKVTIIGGESAISNQVRSQLNQIGVNEIERISGPNRFATSVQIANRYKDTFDSNQVFVASGSSFIDALPASPLAAMQKAPILLTNRDSVPDSVGQWMKENNHVNTLKIVGGTSVISSSTRNQLSGKAASISPPAPAPSEPSAPPTPPQPEATTQFYTVRSGDTLWSIANRFNTTPDRLRQLNNLSSDQIHVGQVLKVPGSGTAGSPSSPQEKTISYTTYTVKSGDNLWNLAMQFGVPMNELLQVNNLNHNSQLRIGQVLTVPVHHIPVKPVVSSRHGELLDWWTEARYVFSTGKNAKITDFQTGRTFNVRHTMGGNHADSEPLTSQDAQIMREIWGGAFSWTPRAVIVEVDGRRLAAAMHSFPHGDHVIRNNNYNGHFCIHFLNSQRHNDGLVQDSMQVQVQIAAGLR